MGNKRISMNEKMKKLLDFMKKYPKIDIRFSYERQNENVLKEYLISKEEFEEIQKYCKYISQNKEKLTDEEIVSLQEACINPKVFGYSSEIEELSEELKEDYSRFSDVKHELFFAIKKYGSIENLKNLYMSGKIGIRDYSSSRLASKLIGLDNPELAKEAAINHNYQGLATIVGINVDDIKKLKHYSDRMSKESELSDLQEKDKKCDEALKLAEQLDKEDKEQEGQTQGDE